MPSGSLKRSCRSGPAVPQDTRTSSAARPNGPPAGPDGAQAEDVVEGLGQPPLAGHVDRRGSRRRLVAGELARGNPVAADDQAGRRRPAQSSGEPARGAHRPRSPLTTSPPAGGRTGRPPRPPRASVERGRSNHHRGSGHERHLRRAPRGPRTVAPRPARPGWPGRRAEAVAAGDSVVQESARSEPPGRLLEGVPADPVALLQPEDAVQSRAQRIKVDQDRGPPPGTHLTQGAGEGRLARRRRCRPPPPPRDPGSAPGHRRR